MTGGSHLLTLDDVGFAFCWIADYIGQGRSCMKISIGISSLTPGDIDLGHFYHMRISIIRVSFPRLVKEGISGKIYATPAARDLTAILLLDSAHIQERESDFTNRKMEEEHKEEPSIM